MVSTAAATAAEGKGGGAGAGALAREEAQWVSRVLDVSVARVEGAVAHAVDNNLAIIQKASTIWPLALDGDDGKRWILKRARTAHLDTPERRRRTSRSLACEHAFYTRLGGGGQSPSLLLPSAKAAFIGQEKGFEASASDARFRLSQKAGEECGVESELLIIVDDARHLARDAAAGGGAALSQVPPLPGGLSASEAAAAVSWLASFHASFMAGDGAEAMRVWEEGGYWSYRKRVKVDGGGARRLPRDETPAAVRDGWRQLLARLGGAGAPAPATGLQRLGFHQPPAAPSPTSFVPFESALAQSGASLSRRLAQGSLRGSHTCATLLHGDFKAANIFVDRQEHRHCTAVDFQWAGWGMGAVDLIYFLTTSLTLDALGDMDKLIEIYHERLEREVERRGENGAGAMSLESLRLQCDLAAADYARYLVGEMWSKVDLASLEASREAANVGMHKRSLPHLVKVCELANAALENLYTRGLGARGLPHSAFAPSDEMRVRLAEGGQEWQDLEPVRREVARVFSCCVFLAKAAGDIVLGVAESGEEFRVTNKGEEIGEFDPQTQADVAAERFILGVLTKMFPTLRLVGEEGIVLDGEDEAFNREVEAAVRELEAHHMDAVAPWEVALPEGCKGMEDVTVWIDPLDGTKELLVGNREGVTTLLGVSVCGKPLLGCIHQPFTARRRSVWGGVGIGGVYEHAASEAPGQARPVPPPPARGSHGGDNGDNGAEGARPRVPRLVTTRSHGSDALRAAIARLGEVETVGVGGAGRKILMVLDGEADAYVFPSAGTKRWDTAAGEPLLEALGGYLADAETGARYVYSAQENPHNLKGIVATIHETWILGRLTGEN